MARQGAASDSPAGTLPSSKGDGPSEVDATDPRTSPKAIAEATPSMAQYLEIKTANPDCVLWYRMGDFYELFFEDAVAASEALGIVLTKRGKHLGEDIPMCGVPVHRADEYLQRLIRQGFRVAVCEQLEDPVEARKRGSKAVVKRDVVRLVTPGTLTEEALLDAKSRNYLTALHAVPRSAADREDRYALASLDISTGELEIAEAGRSDLPGELIRLSPSEVIGTDAVLRSGLVVQWLGVAGATGTPVAAPSFDSLAGERGLLARLGVADLGAFGTFTRGELAALGALLRYVELTQIGKQPLIRPPKRGGAETSLVIDASTRTSLELVKSTNATRDGSLLAAIDRTVTGPGARELAARLASPLRDAGRIAARLDAVGFLLEEALLREELRRTLRATPDVTRAISRLALQRGGPRDLASVRDAIEVAALCKDRLIAAGGVVGLPRELACVAHRLIDAVAIEALGAKLVRALVEAPPHLARDGGFVREGYSSELDQTRRLAENSRRVMAELEARYVSETGIKTLKVRHNNILGYYVEVSAMNARPLAAPPHSSLFRHRQTMANAMRFTTDELVEVEGRIATAGERAGGLELEILRDLTNEVIAAEQSLAEMGQALSELDTAQGLAEIAEREGYVRPLLDASRAFEVVGGRHPVVEQALAKAKAQPFIENDCTLGRHTPAPTGFDEARDPRIWLVTGPNMAGKSTFLRQNALIVVLAQMGSFVPAREARIGIVDRLFSRVGAADDIARGRSTFMVEMVETAAILNQATDRSLVVLDEIGRGTATFDGLSIAWATVEYLHEVTGCRALFATHYHEMTALAGRLAGVANVTMDVKEWKDEIVFLHKVRAGAADRSYGIQVAKLAGLPKPVVARAGEVLKRLEKSDRRKSSQEAGGESSLDDLPLFAAARPSSLIEEPRGPSVVEQELAEIDPDQLSPKAALEALYRLRGLLAGNR